MGAASSTNPLIAIWELPTNMQRYVHREKTEIKDLHSELLSLIFSNLSATEVETKGQVCKTWRHASDDPPLWERLTNRSLHEQQNYQEINNLVISLICRRNCAEDDSRIVQLLERSAAVRAADPKIKVRELDDFVSDLASVLVDFNLFGVKRIYLTNKMPCIQHAASKRDNQLAQFILALDESKEPGSLAALANKGYVYAQIFHSLIEGTGNNFKNGQTLAQSLKTLSDNGHMGAKVQLVDLLKSGDIEKNERLEASLLRELAEAERPFYQIRLALCLLERDRKEAIVWLDRAAHAGNLHACFLLGTLLHEDSNRSLLSENVEELEVHFFLGRSSAKGGLNRAAEKELHQYLKIISKRNPFLTDLYAHLSEMYKTGNILNLNLSKSAEYEALAKTLCDSENPDPDCSFVIDEIDFDD